MWEWDEVKQQEVLASTSTVHRDTIRAYRGVVVHGAHTSQRMHEDRLGVSRMLSGIDDGEGVMGAASIMLHEDASQGNGMPSFEGSFTWAGNEHTIQSSRAYHHVRHPLDPPVHQRSIDASQIVVHRNSDIMSDAEAKIVRRRMTGEGGYDDGDDHLSRRDGSSSSGCSHDAHEYNLNNRLILSSLNNDNASISPLSFFANPATTSTTSSSSLLKRGVDWLDLFASSEDSGHSSLPDVNVRPSIDWKMPTDDWASFSYESTYHSSRSRRRSRQIHRRQSTTTGGGDALGSGSNQSYVSSIGSTSGCPNSAQVVYIGMAADCSFTQLNGGSVANTSTTLLNIMNSVSTIYRNTFNVSLGVVELDVRSAQCPSSTNSSVPWNVGCSGQSTLSIDDRLSAFSQWRGTQPSNGTGLWHLLTACSSSGSASGEIGVAWLGTVCKTDSTKSGGDTVSGTGVTSSTTRDSQTVAHEIGHNFGAIHDCMSGCSLSGSTATQSNGATCCPASANTCNDNDAHIMSPVSQRVTNSFSPCSIGNICTMLGGGLNTSCVETPGQRETLSTQQCGNGILEPGEECDGGANGSRCCTSECKLTSGSKCDPSSSACCTQSCQFASSSTLCRSKKDNSTCDSAEYCTGSSAECPDDKYEENGTSCGDNGLQCANGRCTSRDQQCQEQTSSNTDYTQACSVSADQSCSLACQSPSNAGSCTVFQTNFIDGTACGYGGFCENGECKSGDWQETFKSWYRNNLNIAIPVTIVIALIVLALLYALVRCLILPCFGVARPKRGRRNRKPVSGAMVPPPMRSNGASQQPYYSSVPGGSNSYSNGGGPTSYYSSYPSNNNGRSSHGNMNQGYAPPPGAPGLPPRQGRRDNWVDPAAWNGR